MATIFYRSQMKYCPRLLPTAVRGNAANRMNTQRLLTASETENKQDETAPVTTDPMNNPAASLSGDRFRSAEELTSVAGSSSLRRRPAKAEPRMDTSGSNSVPARQENADNV